MAKVDDLDIKILDELNKDARQSYRELAEKLKIAEGTVYNRIGKLKEMQVLRGFIADIDYAKLGYDLTAILGLKVAGGRLPQIEEKISKEPSVSAVYDVTGEYDALVVAKFKDRAGLNGLVKRILAMPEVDRTYTMVVLNVIKEQHGIKL